MVIELLTVTMEVQVIQLEDVKEQSLHGAVAKRTLGLLRQPHYLLHPLTEEKK